MTISQALRTFDPESVLSALYSMEGVVRSIAEGSWEPTASSAAAQTPTRYSAEDAAGGELYEALQKQPNKRFPEPAVKFYAAEVRFRSRALSR